VDKYFWYVLLSYLATFSVLIGYLVWMWVRLRAVRGEDASEAPR
jgi:hypothetical protein